MRLVLLSEGFAGIDREWFDRGCVQELGGAQVEADGSVLASGAGEQNRRPLCRTLLRPMETMLEIHPLMFYTPHLLPEKYLPFLFFAESAIMRG